jgi:hypothetical protein
MRVGPARIGVLLPYALASVAVIAASAVALLASVRAPAPAPGVALVSPVPSPAGRRAELSDSRMAYWRPAASGSLELWVSDLDGGRRWTIATAGGDSALALTRWSPDGSAIAYRAGNGTLGIVRLDGSMAELVMPLELRRASWRIVGFEWSPDSTRIAATFRAGAGLSNESDVYVAQARRNAAWERVTTLGDAYAGPWIDADRLFIESSSGLIAWLDLRTKDLRPITGIPAVSPQLGRDGRVWFIGGGSVMADVATPVATGWVWSATLDGDGLRREIAAEHAHARLFATLADGRAVIGVPGGMYLASDALVPLVFAGAGTLRRVFVSEDGRRLIGLTDSRILQIDAAKIPRSVPHGQLAPAGAATTLLSGIREPDIWSARRTVTTPATARAAVPPTAPQPRLAFALGHAIWELLPDGSAKAIVTERGSITGRPQWSPTGDRVAVTYVAPGEREPSVLVVGPSGPVRWRLGPGAQGMAWSPDGAALSFWTPGGPQLDRWVTTTYDAASGHPALVSPGRVVWGGGGQVVIDDGELPVTGGGAVTTRLRIHQTLDLITAATRRTITDAQRLAASPLLKDVADAARPPMITQVHAAADPAYVVVTLSRLAPAQNATARHHAHVVVRVADGEPVHVMPMPIDSGPHDLAWSPVGHLLGFGQSEIVASTGATVRRALVIDPLSGVTLVRTDGRFAGWSPDAAWVFVARDDGLYAHRVDGSTDPVRVSTLGVIVSAGARP